MAIVYVIMVATFRSLIQPLVLLVSIPFATTGAIALLLVTGSALGLPSLIGFLMLVGVVFTNAIVLIDLINQYRRIEGMDLDTAIERLEVDHGGLPAPANDAALAAGAEPVAATVMPEPAPPEPMPPPPPISEPALPAAPSVPTN